MEPYLLDEVEFYDHQIMGVRTLINQNSFILADDMGLGKSLQALTVFCADVMRGMAKRLIIVCPVTLKENWAEELGKFTRIPFILLEGTPAKRKQLIEEYKRTDGPYALIVNYEQVVAHSKELNALGLDVAIFDEAHYMKNYKSKRTKACLALRSGRSFLLTGTPVLNNVSELWSLLYKINPKKWGSYWGYINRFCVFGGFNGREIIGTKNNTELRAELSQIMLRRLSKDVLPLKEPVPVVKHVTLSPEQRKLYDGVVKDLVITDAATGEESDVDNALTKFLRLKQICGTTRPFNGEDISAKLDLAIEDGIELHANNQKTIVFTQFVDVLECYQERLTAAGIPSWTLSGKTPMNERQAIVREWTMDPRPGAIVCMLQVAGVGLNMTAARYIQFLDKLYVPGLNNQAIARANRIGQQLFQPVTVLDYICRNTIESRIEQILEGKVKTVHDVVEVSAQWKKSFIAELKASLTA